VRSEFKTGSKVQKSNRKSLTWWSQQFKGRRRHRSKKKKEDGEGNQNDCDDDGGGIILIHPIKLIAGWLQPRVVMIIITAAWLPAWFKLGKRGCGQFGAPRQLQRGARFWNHPSAHTPQWQSGGRDQKRLHSIYTHSGYGSLFFLARIQLEQLLCFAVLSSRLFLLPPIFIRLLRPHIKFIHSSTIYSAVCTRCCWMRASERVCFSKIHFFSFAQSRLRMRARGPGENRFLSVALPLTVLCSTLYTVCCGERKGVAAPVQIKTKRLLCGF